MAKKREQQKSAIEQILSGAGQKQPAAQEADKPEDPVSSYGVGLRVSEWQRVEQIAGEMGITKHAVAAYGLRYFLKAYDAGEIQTVSKPRLPGL